MIKEDVDSEDAVEGFLRQVARAPRSVLLLDYDGTLSPFSVQRKQAVPYRGVASVLQQIVDAGRTRLVIITGREAHEIVPLLGLLPAPEVWGSHGSQRLLSNGTCVMAAIPEKAIQALEEAYRWLEYKGLQEHAESKPGGIAVHWRGLSETDASEVRAKVVLGWSRIVKSGFLSLLEFDGGLELRLTKPDKGDAVQVIVNETDPGVPIAYLGDDHSDENAFLALDDKGFTALVRSAPRPTAARVWLKPPAEVFEFLLGWQRATAMPRGVQN